MKIRTSNKAGKINRRNFMKAGASAVAVGSLAGGLTTSLSMPALAESESAVSYAERLWRETKEALGKLEGYRKTLNIHAWEGYTEEPVLQPFIEQTGATINSQMLISDSSAVNDLRAGGVNNWDILNVNNSWAREFMGPENLIVPLDVEKFKPLSGMNLPEFAWPYKWAMDKSNEKLLGMVQRFGPSAMVVNTDAISRDTIETGGYMEMIEGAKGRYGVIDFEEWVIMHTCQAAGFSPFRTHTEDEMGKFEEMINKIFQNAAKVSDDQTTLARDMVTGEIVGTFGSSLYTASAARNEGYTNITNVVPLEGPEETKTAENPKGRAGVVWIENTSLVNNPKPTPLAEAFLVYCHVPEIAYRVAAKAPGTLNPVVQMGAPEVLAMFQRSELDAIQWGDQGEWLHELTDRCEDFGTNPDYNAMHDMYTAAKRRRGL